VTSLLVFIAGTDTAVIVTRLLVFIPGAGIAVIIVTRLQAENRGSTSNGDNEWVFFSLCRSGLIGPPSLLCNRYRGGSFPGGKACGT
jgi:hypothetical protein